MKIFVRTAMVVPGMAVLALGGVCLVSSTRLGATFDVPVASIETSTDLVVLARGAHVAEIRGAWIAMRKT